MFHIWNTQYSAAVQSALKTHVLRMLAFGIRPYGMRTTTATPALPPHASRRSEECSHKTREAVRTQQNVPLSRYRQASTAFHRWSLWLKNSPWRKESGVKMNFFPRFRTYQQHVKVIVPKREKPRVQRTAERTQTTSEHPSNICKH